MTDAALFRSGPRFSVWSSSFLRQLAQDGGVADAAAPPSRPTTMVPRAHVRTGGGPFVSDASVRGWRVDAGTLARVAQREADGGGPDGADAVIKEPEADDKALRLTSMTFQAYLESTLPALILHMMFDWQLYFE